jgi:hypothetical protein
MKIAVEDVLKSWSAAVRGGGCGVGTCALEFELLGLDVGDDVHVAKEGVEEEAVALGDEGVQADLPTRGRWAEMASIRFFSCAREGGGDGRGLPCQSGT